MAKVIFADWLEKKYLTWQMENGRASIRQFSAWLGVNHALVVQWMNDKASPGQKTLPIVAKKLGPEVYDVLGLPRPDPLEEQWRAKFEAVPPENREEFLRLVEELLTLRGWRKFR